MHRGEPGGVLVAMARMLLSAGMAWLLLLLPIGTHAAMEPAAGIPGSRGVCSALSSSVPRTSVRFAAGVAAEVARHPSAGGRAGWPGARAVAGTYRSAKAAIRRTNNLKRNPSTIDCSARCGRCTSRGFCTGTSSRPTSTFGRTTTG